jgi:GTP-binding protein
MIIANAKFIKSAADISGFYNSSLPQIAVAGKSNVGKSSFINMLANIKKLARTSSEPGRTRLINYFDMGGFVLVDLPGYGYAKASKEETNRWAKMIDDYLTNEKMLKRVIMLVDIRHSPTELDKRLIKYLYDKIIPFSVIATKADKISRAAIKPRLNEISAALRMGEGDIFAVSSVNGYGKDNVLSLIENIISGGNADSVKIP